MKNESCGIGVFCADFQSSRKILQWTSSMSCELNAINMALELCENNNLTKNVIFTDPKVHAHYWKTQHLIQKMKLLFKNYWTELTNRIKFAMDSIPHWHLRKRTSRRTRKEWLWYRISIWKWTNDKLRCEKSNFQTSPKSMKIFVSKKYPWRNWVESRIIFWRIME